MKNHITMIGVGPANLALAIALDELKESNRELSFSMHEKKESFSWHSNFLLPTTSSQTSFIKDLACLRNPKSHFTFISFLHEKNMLEYFVNAHKFHVSRKVYHAYLAWVANQFADKICYRSTLVKIEPIINQQNIVSHLKGIFRNQESGLIIEKVMSNVVLGIGNTPYIPGPCNIQDEAVFHSYKTLEQLSNSNVPSTPHFLVVGGGQSSVELCKYLLSKYTNSTITVVSRNFLFKEIDSNPFVNMLFGNMSPIDFKKITPEFSEYILSDLSQINFGVSSPDLLKDLFNFCFEEKIQGRNPLRLMDYSQVLKVARKGSKIEVLVESKKDNQVENILADIVICATGFCYDHLSDLLTPLKPWILNHDHNPHYLLPTVNTFKPNVYLFNLQDNCYGFSEGSMTNLPHRAMKIAEHLLQASLCEACNDSFPLTSMTESSYCEYT